MRILFVTKRHPQQRDLIERPYGRFHYLPVALARAGHDVGVTMCSIRRLRSARLVRDGVSISSHDVFALGLPALWQTLLTEARAFRPDWIIGCADSWTAVLAARLARRVGAQLAIDVYDNYEAYMPWNLPLRWAWRRAVFSAALVTAAGPQLAQHLQQFRPNKRRAEVVPMAADPEFIQRDRMSCRAALSLPATAPLLGYIGSWARRRGTDGLIDSFDRIKQVRADARLVLSGTPPAAVSAHPGVIALGYLRDADVPLLVCALDVACVITADTPFGRHSYPAKLCEAMACGVPVVATASAPICWMLGDDARFLAQVGNAEDLASRALANLALTNVAYPNVGSWTDSARQLETLLKFPEANTAGG